MTSGPTTGAITTFATHLSIGIASEKHGLRADAIGVVERAEHKGRNPTRGNAHHDIISGTGAGFKGGSSGFGLVFRAFLGSGQRGCAACDDAVYQVGLYPISRRAFSRVEHAEAPACARAHVKEPPALLKCFDHEIHGFGYVAYRAFNRMGDFLVFGIDDPKCIRSRTPVDVGAVGIALLREQPRPF